MIIQARSLAVPVRLLAESKVVIGASLAGERNSSELTIGIAAAK